MKSIGPPSFVTAKVYLFFPLAWVTARWRPLGLFKQWESAPTPNFPLDFGSYNKNNPAVNPSTKMTAGRWQ